MRPTVAGGYSLDCKRQGKRLSKGGALRADRKGGEERGRDAHGKRLSKGGALRADRKGGEEREEGLLMGYTALRRHELPKARPHSPHGCTPSRP